DVLVAVDGDQHVPPMRRRDLAKGCVQHGHVISGGERAGVARAQHHGQVVADVGAPRRHGVESESALVGARGLFFGRGRLDQRGVQTDHRHRR
ncbi:hypothetical protein NPS74_21225, partial [Cutibacterium acnes subsp. acnes]|nr:hypothetical protein [Cutibacterium acnes subsp. acnes]